MIGFLAPQLLLLGIPVAYALVRWRAASLMTNVVRGALAAALLLALAEPYVARSAPGRDLIVVVDRSLSMPEDSDASALELIRLAEENRAPGDRVGVVTFGGSARLARTPSEAADFAGFGAREDPDASDLHEALETALGMIPQGRAGSLLLLSDGEANGRDPVGAARRAFARGVRIDARLFAREAEFDVSVERLELPETTDAGEPFQFSGWVEADRRTEVVLVLERDGETISRTKRTLEPGTNRVLLRDVLARPGVARYALRVEGERDRVPENDVGISAVRVAGPRSLLLVNDTGAPDSLSRALERAGLPVVTVTPEAARLDRIALAAHRAVVFENVAANRFRDSLEDLSDFVTERGGGFLMTGGEASFGIGGYHLSRVDELLPVSMELRQEHRKMAVAMVIVMDRSGSMAAGVEGGRTKMDLANLGARSVIDLLSPMDHLGVLAVDSAPHEVLPLAPVTDRGALGARVARVESMGGGIFVHDGLFEARAMLAPAKQLNRHVLLFSDAADSEQQEGCIELIEDMRALNMTLSVIALGTEHDTDADFLKDVAKRGGGEVYFTTDALELPRLFAQDTLTIARSTFVEEPTATRTLAALFGMGATRAEEFPDLRGYNLTYLRPEGVAGIVTLDEYAAPVFAHRYHGLGRTAAFTAQVGGSFGADVVAWEGFAEFFVTTARWLLGQEEPREIFTEVRREGREAVVSLEVDPEQPLDPDTSDLVVRMTDPDGRTTQHVLERVAEHRYEARAPLSAGGISLGTVRLGGERFVELPPVALPYSPEFERPSDAEAGARLLRRLAAETGGRLDASAKELFRGPRAGTGWRVLSAELILAALLLLLVEIAGRRLDLWSGLRLPRRTRVAANAPVPEAQGARAATSAEPRTEPDAAPREAPAAPAAQDALSDALARARRTADRRLGR